MFFDGNAGTEQLSQPLSGVEIHVDWRLTVLDMQFPVPAMPEHTPKRHIGPERVDMNIESTPGRRTRSISRITLLRLIGMV